MSTVTDPSRPAPLSGDVQRGGATFGHAERLRAVFQRGRHSGGHVDSVHVQQIIARLREEAREATS